MARRSSETRRDPVTCPDCLEERMVSARQAFRVRVGEATGCCHRCDGLRRKASVEVSVTQDLRDWWLARYSPDELRVLAAGLSGWDEWGPAPRRVVREARDTCGCSFDMRVAA